MPRRLAQAAVSARWIGIPGRAILSTKSHHFVVDSPLALGGPNEEVTPLDLVLAAFAGNAMFVCRRVIEDEGVVVERLTAHVIGLFDPRGMRGEPVDPRLQAIEIHFEMVGPSQEQAARILDAYRARCVIYNTLACALPIAIELTLQSPAASTRLASGGSSPGSQPA